MRKRVLCFVAAAVLVLLPLNAPAGSCENGHADPSDYYLVGKKQPTETEPGYSGDYYCPVCHTLMVRGWKIDPLPPSGGNGTTGQPAVQPSGNGGQKEKSQSAGNTNKKNNTKKQKSKASSGKKSGSNSKAKSGTTSKQKSSADKNTKSTAKPGKKQPEREHFSKDYPFRRVRMNPEPGIRAPAAGELVWPKASTPMQKMLSGD